MDSAGQRNSGKSQLAEGVSVADPPATVCSNRTARDYVAAPNEREAAQRVLDRRKNGRPMPRFNVSYDGSGKVTIDPDHVEPAATIAAFADVLGTGDGVFSNGILDQLANSARTGRQLTSGELNFMVSTVRAIGPRDPTEALLAVQMAAIHNATMIAARRLNHVEPAFSQVEAPKAGLSDIAGYWELQISRGEQAGLPGPGCLLANTMTERAPHAPDVAKVVAAHNNRLRAGFRNALRGQGIAARHRSSRLCSFSM